MLDVNGMNYNFRMSKAVLQLQEQVAAANAENEKKKDEIFSAFLLSTSTDDN